MIGFYSVLKTDSRTLNIWFQSLLIEIHFYIKSDQKQTIFPNGFIVLTVIALHHTLNGRTDGEVQGKILTFSIHRNAAIKIVRKII